MNSASEILFSDHKGKSELLSSITITQLSQQTVAGWIEHISDNMESVTLWFAVMWHCGLQSCEYFSFKIDEYTDVMLIVVYIWKSLLNCFPFMNILEEIFNVFLKFVKNSILLLSKLFAITTEEVPSMTGKTIGSYSLC